MHISSWWMTGAEVIGVTVAVAGRRRGHEEREAMSGYLKAQVTLSMGSVHKCHLLQSILLVVDTVSSLDGMLKSKRIYGFRRDIRPSGIFAVVYSAIYTVTEARATATRPPRAMPRHEMDPALTPADDPD